MYFGVSLKVSKSKILIFIFLNTVFGLIKLHKKTSHTCTTIQLYIYGKLNHIILNIKLCTYRFLIVNKIFTVFYININVKK